MDGRAPPVAALGAGRAPLALVEDERLVVLAVELRERVLADEKVRAATDGKQVAKVIFVAGKLVNVVVR